eukprot:349801-Chlamydomonas_euryale.AAC.1
MNECFQWPCAIKDRSSELHRMDWTVMTRACGASGPIRAHASARVAGASSARMCAESGSVERPGRRGAGVWERCESCSAVRRISAQNLVRLRRICSKSWSAQIFFPGAPPPDPGMK